MSASAFYDTNVLIYVFDQAEPAKQARAQELLSSVRPTLSAQVLSEFYVTVTRKLAKPVSPELAQQAVAEWSRFTVVPVTGALVQAAAATAAECQLSYWDSLIVEAALAGGCRELLTEDLSDGATLRGVRIRNPFV
ncbi:MAG: PIN domain-containing protein [Bifidobacteriaceae bacterium]|jgi:predicted nucleic acid-binding protein|nr:PIN domain-containing protein [Bifidobacteriaceae bacterium]